MAVRPIAEMHLDGGIACLDFVNTSFTSEKISVDRLETYHDVLVLCARLSLFSDATLSNLTGLAQADPQAAETALAEIKVCRVIMRDVLTAVATGNTGQLRRENFSAFHNRIAAAISRQELVVQHNQLTWVIAREPALTVPEDAFLLSAYDLLRNGNQAQVKKCDACDWLFFDTTKNHRRRWCDMQTCGSANKSKTYYQNKIRNKARVGKDER